MSFPARLCLGACAWFAAIAAQGVEHAETPSDDAAFAEEAGALERRISELAAIDPWQPETLDARLAYVRLLHEASAGECLPQLDQAEQQLASLIGAERAQLLAWPDGPGDALSLLQTIQNTRGQCAEDEATARKAFESAIATGQRAVELLRDNWDYEEMAIARFNIAFARRELGDLDGALDDLEQVLAWDREFGLRDELAGDYETYLRWRNGGEAPDPAEVGRFAASFRQTKARFAFAWKPHRAQWTTQSDRAALKSGVLREATSRYDSEVRVSRERDQWVLETTMASPPKFAATGAAGAALSEELLQQVLTGFSSTLPELVIAADGSFKELRNLAKHRADLARELERLVAASTPAGKPAPGRDVLDPLLETALNPELLTAYVAGQWNITVAAWIDGEFDHGDWYTVTFQEPLPGVSEHPVTMTWTFKVSRWLPCAEGRDPDCVELLLRISPDADDIREALAGFVGRLLPKASRAEVEKAMRAVSYRMELRYRLVTEPDTLRPWSVEERKYIYGASIEGGRREVAVRRDQTIETARYED